MFGLPSPVYLIAAALLLVATLTVAIITNDLDEPVAENAAETAAKTATNEASTPQDTFEENDEVAEVEASGAPNRLLGEGDGELVSRSEAPSAERRQSPAVSEVAAGEGMTMTVPKLGLDGVPIPSGSSQQRLDREGILRMSGSGLPWEAGSNTFIVGHTLGYQGTKVPYAFYDLDEMKPGDRITVNDSSGTSYDFEVYDEMTVRPEDYWVTYPQGEGRTIISLQSCVPIPEFDMRLVVQAELVGESRS